MSPARPSPRRCLPRTAGAGSPQRRRPPPAAKQGRCCLRAPQELRDDTWRGERDGGERMDKNWGHSRGLLAGCHSHALRKDDARGDGNNAGIVRPRPLAGDCPLLRRLPHWRPFNSRQVFLLRLLPALSAGTASPVPAGTPGQRSVDAPCLSAALRACAREGGRLLPPGTHSQCQPLSQRKHESSLERGAVAVRVSALNASLPAPGDIGRSSHKERSGIVPSSLPGDPEEVPMVAG